MTRSLPALTIYFWAVVYSFYKELQESDGRAAAFVSVEQGTMAPAGTSYQPGYAKMAEPAKMAPPAAAAYPPTVADPPPAYTYKN